MKKTFQQKFLMNAIKYNQIIAKLVQMGLNGTEWDQMAPN